MGAGYHGGFGGTKGAANQKAPVNSYQDVAYSNKKIEGYLLNPNHLKGKSKAKFFHDVLGYSQNDGKIFHKNLVSSIIGKVPSQTEKTAYGLKYTFHTKLIGKNNQSISANIVVIVQKDNGKSIYKIVTVYPDKKG